MNKYRNEITEGDFKVQRTYWLGRDLLLWSELRHVTMIMGVLLGQPNSDYRESDRSQPRSQFSLPFTSRVTGVMLVSKP